MLNYEFLILYIMKLYKITISGADEHTDVKELVAFIEQYYHYKGINIELGIQVSPTKASFDSDRYRWLMKLHEQALGFCYVHLALHINPVGLNRFVPVQFHWN